MIRFKKKGAKDG